MTSLELFDPPVRRSQEPPDWGTGREAHAPRENLWVAKPPTWQYSGRPTQQHYGLTKLKLSNVRTNDQLLPNSQHSNMHPLVIQKPFPAEHPYHSHIPQFAVIPTFESPSDPKRGVEARQRMPKNAEMPSQPFDVRVINQTKGSGVRHEIQALPPESQKLPLEWKSHDFDQIPKSPWNNKQDFYPIPPKLFVPSHQQRSDGKCIRGNMTVSPGTADTTKNVERNQWQTTYDLNHTGLGPTNALKLENWQDKQMRAGDDDHLDPRSIRTMDPPRPVEGRIARELVPPPAPQTDRYANPPSDPSYRRKLTLTEKEENRLWNGQEYWSLPDASLPGNKHTNQQWHLLQSSSHPEPGMSTLAGTMAASVPGRLPHTAQGPPGPDGEDYIEELARKQHADFQQVEAANRWAVLEEVTPAKDITALHHKMELVSSKTQPHVFYDHEGKYQEERAGLYKTSYDPHLLEHAMNKEEKCGARAFDVSESHRDALDLPVDLNEEMAHAIRYNRTQGGPPGSVPQLHAQPSQYEAFGTFDTTRSKQSSKLQPSATAARVRIQEDGVVLKETTMGEGYNTRKFLQENKLDTYARNEPTILMSNENQDLKKVWMSATPSDGVPGIRRPNIPHEKELPNLSRPGTAPELNTNGFGERYSYQAGDVRASVDAVNVASPEYYPKIPVSLKPDRETKLQQKHGGHTSDQFASTSTNFIPGDVVLASGFKAAYQNQFPSYNSVDMTFKNDFNWKPGSGPRPQTVLLDIQNSFTRSNTRKDFHRRFPENGPDLRENILAGRKHTFGSMNAQVLRGTPIVQVA